MPIDLRMKEMRRNDAAMKNNAGTKSLSERKLLQLYLLVSFIVKMKFGKMIITVSLNF